LYYAVFPPSRPDFRGDIGADREEHWLHGLHGQHTLAAWARLDIDHPDYQIRPMP
jgi:hypothetical protein